MKVKITKNIIIIAVITIIYIVALPLTLHLSGAFKQKELPDLKILTSGFDIQYANMSDEEKHEILSGMGFDLQTFENAGFAFSVKDMWVYVFENEPERIYSLSMEITDLETYCIKLTIYTSEADMQNSCAFFRYERREINGKPVGFYETDSKNALEDSLARYREAKTGCVYYIEPLLGFHETEYEFLSILTSQIN